YLRRRTGIAPSRAGASTTRRFFSWKWTWASLIIIAACAVTFIIQFHFLKQPTYYADGSSVPGLNDNALWMCAKRALPTMVFWIVAAILVDRYKPQRFLVWFFALAWGGCVATCASLFLNSWAGEQLAVINDQSGVSSLRTAIFIAPFVEEATKGCVIFLIAALDRNRFTSRVSGAVIGILAGAGFAFTENIIYYARVVVYGSMTAGTGDVKAYLDYMVQMRGIYTAFGHPLFTMMTGLGVGFAIASRSKIVRLLAPAAGFLAAAFLHMFFNFRISLIPQDIFVPVMLIIAWPLVAIVAMRLVRSSLAQGRTVEARLTDYVAMGWLPSHYPAALSRVRRRLWALMMSPWHGNLIATWRLQVRATELAMLREAMTRGVVDQGGLSREYDIVNELAALAGRKAVVEGKGLRPYWPWRNWWRRRRQRRGATTPSTRGISSSMATRSPVRYSAVDSRWGPPG
ncbi:MAG: PrsW family intramembrane metalloprotease, partial [Propionibacteriaceae bacterium]|nr:PrsW family intramembrane metalloprotease [Propionibacteriaceae bacterium]